MKVTLTFDYRSYNHYYPDGGILLKDYHLDGNSIGDDFLQAIKDNLSYLESHNKNYTNKQYYLIQDLQDIFKFMNVEMEVK